MAAHQVKVLVVMQIHKQVMRAEPGLVVKAMMTVHELLQVVTAMMELAEAQYIQLDLTQEITTQGQEIELPWPLVLLAELQQVTLLEELAALAEVILHMSEWYEWYEQVQVQVDQQAADHDHKDLEEEVVHVTAFQLMLLLF